MNTKKEQLLFVIRFCTAFFAAAVLLSYIAYVSIGKEGMPLTLVGQFLVMDAFIFAGMLFGATDLVIKIRSVVLRSAIVSVVLYAGLLILLMNTLWNPLGNMLKLVFTTFLFACAAAIITLIYGTWQQAQTRKYHDLIEQFKVTHTEQ